MQSRSARAWLLDFGLAVAATLLGLFFTSESVSDGEGAPHAVEAVAAVLSFAALVLFRRSHPVALALALIPSGIVLGMPMGFTPFALFSVGVRRPVRVTLALSALHTALVCGVYALAVGITDSYWEAVSFLIPLHVAVVAVAMLVRSQRQLVLSWAERARQAEEGQVLRVDQARAAERERIAREMHDVLAHRISLLAVHAGALEVRKDAEPGEREAAGVIRRCAYEALEDLRGVIGMLRTPEDDADRAEADRPQPTLDDVPALVEESRATGAEVDLSVAGGAGPPAQVGRHAYRIVQEALTNARKHAPGAPVRVEISGDADQGLTVRVDNELRHTVVGAPLPRGAKGPGVAVAARLPGAGAGLVGLRERVQLVGGRLEHGPTANGEFRLRAWLPWQP